MRLRLGLAAVDQYTKTRTDKETSNYPDWGALNNRDDLLMWIFENRVRVQTGFKNDQ